jgi:hypothetical protein
VSDRPCESTMDLNECARALFNETFDQFTGIDDFTIVYPDDVLNTRRSSHNWFSTYLSQFSGDNQEPRELIVAEFSETLDFLDKDNRRCEVRIHACRSFSKAAWTLTVRWQSKPSVSNFHPSPAHSAAQELAKFEPKGWSDGYLFGTSELVKAIWRQWPTALPSRGLVLVTGETGSQKSQVTRGLIHSYLHALFADVIEPAVKQHPRKPHLLTFEDPIESLLRPLDLPELANEVDESGDRTGFEEAFTFLAPRHLDYTPRVLRKDVSELSNGLLKDALRQTPALVFAGELREPKQFGACLDFAATGHLVVATAHAGSVIEAMSKLLASVEAKTSGERAIYVSRILSVVHLKKLALRDAKLKAPPVVPAMWRQTAIGIQQLVADGLASLLPANPGPESSAHEIACLGRAFFVGALTELMRLDPDPFRQKTVDEDLMIMAFEDDLNLNG